MRGLKILSLIDKAQPSQGPSQASLAPGRDAQSPTSGRLQFVADLISGPAEFRYVRGHDGLHDVSTLAQYNSTAAGRERLSKKRPDKKKRAAFGEHAVSKQRIERICRDIPHIYSCLSGLSLAHMQFKMGWEID
jgi:hypothetical protein